MPPEIGGASKVPMPVRPPADEENPTKSPGAMLEREMKKRSEGAPGSTDGVTVAPSRASATSKSGPGITPPPVMARKNSAPTEISCPGTSEICMTSVRSVGLGAPNWTTPVSGTPPTDWMVRKGEGIVPAAAESESRLARPRPTPARTIAVDRRDRIGRSGNAIPEVSTRPCRLTDQGSAAADLAAGGCTQLVEPLCHTSQVGGRVGRSAAAPR
jgi:hypothetical protein